MGGKRWWQRVRDERWQLARGSGDGEQQQRQTRTGGGVARRREEDNGAGGDGMEMIEVGAVGIVRGGWRAA